MITFLHTCFILIKLIGFEKFLAFYLLGMGFYRITDKNMKHTIIIN